MKKKNKRTVPEIVEGDKPTLQERLQDIDDLKTLKAMRKRPLMFRKLEDFLPQRCWGA